jgi:hypothetical protein
VAAHAEQVGYGSAKDAAIDEAVAALTEIIHAVGRPGQP